MCTYSFLLLVAIILYRCLSYFAHVVLLLLRVCYLLCFCCYVVLCFVMFLYILGYVLWLSRGPNEPLRGGARQPRGRAAAAAGGERAAGDAERRGRGGHSQPQGLDSCRGAPRGGLPAARRPAGEGEERPKHASGGVGPRGGLYEY